MTFKELMDLVTALKKTGYSEEELANIFVQIYLDGKCCLKDLEKMMTAVGYKLTDEFYQRINKKEEIFCPHKKEIRK